MIVLDELPYLVVCNAAFAGIRRNSLSVTFGPVADIRMRQLNDCFRPGSRLSNFQIEDVQRSS